jgi:uncharacterized protein (TIGR02246 family)
MASTEDQVRTEPGAADRAAIAALPVNLTSAWQAHDAAAFADLFIDDGTMILPGLYRKGKEDIRAYMAQAFEGAYRGTRVTGEPIHLKMLNDDSAVLVTKGGVLAPDETEVHPSREIRASWIVVRQGGQWKLAAYHNSPVNV